MPNHSLRSNQAAGRVAALGAAILNSQIRVFPAGSLQGVAKEAVARLCSPIPVILSQRTTNGCGQFLVPPPRLSG